jgi:hypothetical protein
MAYYLVKHRDKFTFASQFVPELVYFSGIFTKFVEGNDLSRFDTDILKYSVFFLGNTFRD